MIFSTATASIATPETDAELRQRVTQEGSNAKIAGLPISACPWRGGLCEMWWREGYDNGPQFLAEAQ